MAPAASSNPTRHDLYIVQRPLENLLAKAVVGGARIVGELTKEEGLHCGVRSIANDEYRYDYHIEKAEGGRMRYIAEALANNRGITKYREEKDKGNDRNRKSKSPDPSEVIGWVNMSGESIREESDKLLERFNGPQDKSPFPIGGGYDIVRQNCQHFAACLVMRLCGSSGVNEEDVIKLVWGDIKGGEKHKRVTAQLRAIAKSIQALPQ